jgi:hypothetical protein
MVDDFDWKTLTENERRISIEILGCGPRPPDLIIAPDGEPYLYRWYLCRTPEVSVYFHIQVKDDPERPLHDHPWDNQSTILSGGYNEILYAAGGPPQQFHTRIHARLPKDVIQRKAEWSHRLLLPPNVKRSMSVFATGPKDREWGFWYPEGWRGFSEVTKMVGNKSVHTGMV